MKRIAFLQAFLIVVLLLASWFLLINKLRQPDNGTTGPETKKSSETVLTEPNTAAGPEIPQTVAESVVPPDPAALVPEGWREWFTYLAEVQSPMEMRTALEALRTALYSLPDEEAVARLMEFIESGADMKTGLAFQPGPDNQLRGAASLRALFLDWLQQLDPQAAARIAARELDSIGTGLNPDVYVVHLRNFALGSGESEAVMQAALENYFGQLLAHQPWIDDPNSAIAEAMDVAVYLESPAFVPELSQLLQADQAPLLRRAASLALERLVDQQPMKVLPLLVDGSTGQSLPERSRASYMARLDPGLPGAENLLEEYVLASARDPGEIRFFLQSFPNLNQSYSHNLLSAGISDTNPGAYLDHLGNALDLIRAWRDNPRLDDFAPLLGEIQERLELQLDTNP